eukprot:NODE_675_length_5306_cov_0.405224.p1 type:complete len:558 gc:universal NODE_675_length_5306_cov_0.405224:3350-5023(+)
MKSLDLRKKLKMIQDQQMRQAELKPKPLTVSKTKTTNAQLDSKIEKELLAKLETSVSDQKLNQKSAVVDDGHVERRPSGDSRLSSDRRYNERGGYYHDRRQSTERRVSGDSKYISYHNRRSSDERRDYEPRPHDRGYNERYEYHSDRYDRRPYADSRPYPDDRRQFEDEHRDARAPYSRRDSHSDRFSSRNTVSDHSSASTRRDPDLRKSSLENTSTDFRRDSRDYSNKFNNNQRNDFNADKRPHSQPNDATAFMQGDRRLKTVLVSQINTRAAESDIFRYFDRIGKVRQVKLMYDKSSQRSKGLAYVEFLFGDSIPKALEMDKSIFMGGPLTVERVSDDSFNDQYADLLGQITVSRLHSSVTSEDLKELFSEFGKIKSVYMGKDSNGQSSGKSFITFDNKTDAQNAVKEMNGFEFMGQPMQVINDVEVEPEKETKRHRYTKKDASNRVMQMLASKINHGTESRCLSFSNLFNKSHSAQDLIEISEDVRQELDTLGRLLHYDMNKEEELVYCKFENMDMAQSAFKKINGRFFDKKIVKASYVIESIYADKYPETSYQ